MRALAAALVTAGVLGAVAYAGDHTARIVQGGSLGGTATGNINMSTYSLSLGADPGDGTGINLPNDNISAASRICWEASPAGTDVCVYVQASELLTLSGATGYAGIDGTAANPAYTFNSDVNGGLYRPGSGQVGLSAGSTAILNAASTGLSLLKIRQADLTAGSCTANDIALDTGGATKELCFCQATNTWYCWSVTTATGPTD